MAAAPCILVLDSNRRNLDLLAGALRQAGFAVHLTGSPEDVDAALDSDVEISLALLGLAGFDAGLWERCDRLRQRGIPFLVISPRPSPAAQQAGLDHGARGVLVKPLSAKALLDLVQLLVKS